MKLELEPVLKQIFQSGHPLYNHVNITHVNIWIPSLFMTLAASITLSCDKSLWYSN